MLPFIVDKRDLEFTLFDQYNVDTFGEFSRYEGMNREMFDMILQEGIKLSQEVLRPTHEPADREGCRLEDGQVIVPESYQAAWKAYREGGWVAMAQRPEQGGMGLPMALSVALIDVFIGASTSFMFFGGLTAAAGHIVENFGTKELRDLVVPKMYSGEWTGTMCLTEPQAGSAVGDLTTTATPIEGSPNEYSITGNKIFISCGDHDLGGNVVHLVLARVPGDAEGTRGISLFLVPKLRFDAKGTLLESNDVTVSGIEHKMGINGCPTCTLSFGDNGECRGYLIGERSRGLVYMFQMMNEARIICGVQGSAIANASYQLALDYAKVRSQGAKVTDRSDNPKAVAIVEHPDVRRNLMLCKSISEGIRALLVQVAAYADLAEAHPDEAQRVKYHDLLDLLTPICKAYATDQAFKVTELAIQVHGGYGYIQEYGVEQYMRDLKIASIYEGTNGIQALDLLGRKMRLKNGGLFLTWLQEANGFINTNKDHARLGDLFTAVDKAKNSLAQTAFGFSQQGKKDMEVALLGATPFLEMFGHVEVARILTQQALIADTQLSAMIGDTDDFDAAVAAKVDVSEEARFLDNKIKTARFFIHAVLPQARALAKSIESADRSALDVSF